MTAERQESGGSSDAEQDDIANVDAHRTFLATLVAAVLFIGVVITFII